MIAAPRARITRRSRSRQQREPYQPGGPIQRSAWSSCRPACSRPCHACTSDALRVGEEKGRPGSRWPASRAPNTRNPVMNRSMNTFGRRLPENRSNCTSRVARQPDAPPSFSSEAARTPANRKAEVVAEHGARMRDDHPRSDSARTRHRRAGEQRRLPGTGSPCSRNTPANTTA